MRSSALRTSGPYIAWLAATSAGSVVSAARPCTLATKSCPTFSSSVMRRSACVTHRSSARGPPRSSWPPPRADADGAVATAPSSAVTASPESARRALDRSAWIDMPAPYPAARPRHLADRRANTRLLYVRHAPLFPQEGLGYPEGGTRPSPGRATATEDESMPRNEQAVREQRFTYAEQAREKVDRRREDTSGAAGWVADR